MINLTQSSIISIIVNLVVFFVFLVVSFILISKIKLDQKGYKYLFWLYTIFWIPIMLVRPYRGTMQNAIDTSFYTIVIAVYGAIGIFIRVFADIISYLFKYRKIFLYFCAISEIALFIPLIIIPNTATNICSSIGIGIGASCIGTYELLFKEQYGNKKAFLTVSILAIPPLLANFLTAPVQSIMKTISTVNNAVDPLIMRWMWLIGLPFIIIAFIMLLFLKEKPMIRGLENTNKIHKSQLKNSNFINWIFFINIAIIGSVVAFIKFTNSDALATTHIQNLGILTNQSTSSYEGYISVIFGVFQLIASIMMGFYLFKKMRTEWIFVIGSSSWIIYQVSSAFISNPIAYIAIHGINGFGYGILYNLTLAMVLSISSDNKIVTKMGWYQSILAIGITGSGFYTSWIKKSILPNKTNISQFTLSEYMHIYFVQNMILAGIIIFITVWFIMLLY
ncbi:MAG: MFS transporter, partial [Ureaplasma sp.]|nr:MFS transporter [Ureaplasma sp.]